MMKTSLLCWLAAAVVFAKSTAVDATEDEADASPPKNIILFMTDDQDTTANSIDPDIMPRLNRLFREGGMEFSHYYVSTGLCCPSRTTILRGQYCHNTEIFDNGDLNNSTHKSGGWSKFLEDGLEEETFATHLQSAGYETFLVGKYMNGYGGKKAVGSKPPGWDHWLGIVRYSFYGPAFIEDGQPLQTNETVYQTDFIRDRAVDFLTSKRDPSKPFFLMVTPFAPHTPAIPAGRHEHLFPDARFPRYDSFNPPDDVQKHRPAYLKRLLGLTDEQISGMDEFYGRRLRSLQAVDEALEKIAETLDELGLTDDTYFIYTSDNGQHFGDHRLPAGKRQAFESDVLVPFLVRGPGVPKGTASSQVVQSVDLGPTFLDIASSSRKDSKEIDRNGFGINSDGKLLKSSYPMDGKSILPLLSGNGSDSSKNHNGFRWAALLEMYGGSSNLGLRYKNMSGYYRNHMYPNTYQAVRVVNGPPEWDMEANLLYVEWCTGEQELFNMTVDPHQVHNLIAPGGFDAHGKESTDASRPDNMIPLLHRLSKILARLGSCKGAECYELEAEYLESPRKDLSTERALSLESMQEGIRNRIPCHDPPSTTSQSFVNDRIIPAPFTDGFPFSDGDSVGEDLLRTWEFYEHYFY